MPIVVPFTDVTSTTWPRARVPFQPMPPSHQVQLPSPPLIVTKLVSLSSVMSRYDPTLILLALAREIVYEPAALPPVIALEFALYGVAS